MQKDITVLFGLIKSAGLGLLNDLVCLTICLFLHIVRGSGVIVASFVLESILNSNLL